MSEDWDKGVDVSVKLPEGRTTLTILGNPVKQVSRFGREEFVISTDKGTWHISTQGQIAANLARFKRQNGDIKNVKITVERQGTGPQNTRYIVINVEKQEPLKQ